MTAAFDPARHLRPLNGSPYLRVADRIAWLRSAHPGATIDTELVQFDPEFPCVDGNGQVKGRGRAVFKATVSIPGGGSATAYGSETAADFGDYIEKGESKAIGRALRSLGYSAEFVPGAQKGRRR